MEVAAQGGRKACATWMVKRGHDGSGQLQAVIACERHDDDVSDDRWCQMRKQQFWMVSGGVVSRACTEVMR